MANCNNCIHDKCFAERDADNCKHYFPTIDMVKIVRCKDCIHRKTEKCPMYYEDLIEWDDDGWLELDTIIDDRTEDNGFCNHGERE